MQPSCYHLSQETGLREWQDFLRRTERMRLFGDSPGSHLTACTVVPTTGLIFDQSGL